MMDIKVNSQPFPNINKLFFIFISTHIVLWTLIPSLIRKNLPLDVVEGIAWGSQWQWGYYKHPFLAPWFSQIAAMLSPQTGWVTYLFCQLSIGICFLSVWRLALKLSTPLQAFFSVLLLEGVLYYNFTSSGFNPNVIMLATWSLAYLAFYHALKKQSLLTWVLTGIICGLTLVSKYYSAALLLAMFGFLLWNNTARKSFTNIHLYLGFIAFIVVISPNMLWLYNHHFDAIFYAFNRANSTHSLITHVTAVLAFVRGQLLDIALALIVFFTVVFNKNKLKINFDTSFDQQFLLFMFLGPLIITLFFPLISGDNLRDMWGTPLFSLLGIFLINLAPDNYNNDVAKIKTFQLWIYAIMFLLLIIYSLSIFTAPLFKPHGSREYFPGKTLAKKVTELWQQQFHTPLHYIVGNTWLSSNIAFYSIDKPIVFLDADFNKSPWIRPQDLFKRGAAVVWQQQQNTCQPPIAYKNAFPDLVCKTVVAIPYQMTASRYRVQVGIGFVSPKNAE